MLYFKFLYYMESYKLKKKTTKISYKFHYSSQDIPYSVCFSETISE